MYAFEFKWRAIIQVNPWQERVNQRICLLGKRTKKLTQFWLFVDFNFINFSAIIVRHSLFDLFNRTDATSLRFYQRSLINCFHIGVYLLECVET